MFDCTCNAQNSLLLNQHNGDDAPQGRSISLIPLWALTWLVIGWVLQQEVHFCWDGRAMQLRTFVLRATTRYTAPDLPSGVQSEQDTKHATKWLQLNNEPKLHWHFLHCKKLTFWGRNYFLILAHPVYKMWIIQEPNMSELWNKLHLEEEKTEIIHHV